MSSADGVAGGSAHRRPTSLARRLLSPSAFKCRSARGGHRDSGKLFMKSTDVMVMTDKWLESTFPRGIGIHSQTADPVRGREIGGSYASHSSLRSGICWVFATGRALDACCCRWIREEPQRSLAHGPARTHDGAMSAAWDVGEEVIANECNSQEYVGNEYVPRSGRSRVMAMMMVSRVPVFAVCALVLAGCSMLSPSTESGSQEVDPTGGGATAAAAPTSAPGFSIETHSRTDLKNYELFTFMTATVRGLSPDATATADERIRGMVDTAVNSALAADDGRCTDGVPKCGSFELALTILPCAEEVLCLKQDVNGAPVGSATSDQRVDVLVLDPKTGRAVDLTRFVPRGAKRNFVASVNDAVSLAQEQAGFYDPAFPNELTVGDFAGWAPLADRIQIWFSRYDAGPGAMGAVTVTVPYPEKTSQSTSAAAPAVKDLAGGDEALYIICTTDMSTMPILRNESSDAWGASVAQTVLYVMGYYESVSDGIYGPITRAAVKAFQRDAGIIVDGLVGPQTWTALQSSHCADFPYE